MSDVARPAESRRDSDELRRLVTTWLTQRPGLHQVVVTEVVVPESNGMSSETVMVDAAWSDDPSTPPESHALVFRMAPDPDAMPIFESYDLESQFRTMRDVARLCAVPIPAAIWYEPDASRLGSEFFVMERCDGQIPADVLPYNFGDSFLYDASPGEQEQLQRSSVGLLATLHEIDSPRDNFAYLSYSDQPDSAGALRSHLQSLRRQYSYVTSDGLRSPLMEQAFAWIESNWPDDPKWGDPVLLWGDARIGNVIYRDFNPVAVLDWEMAIIGPRELDLAWMIFMHQFFEDVARQMSLPGMPGFMRSDDVIATYRSLTGYQPRDMDFFAVFAALQHAIIMRQVARRAIAFGVSEMPGDVDDLIMHRKVLADYIGVG